MTTTVADSPQTNTEPVRVISGRWVVAGMFLFAIVITATLWVFWKMHIGPFLPLQKKLAAEFDDSRPRVEGGQRKIHKGTVKLLRITMKVEFDPTEKKRQAEDFADRVFAFVTDVFDWDTYELFELHLYWPDPEKTIKEATIEREFVPADDS